MGQNNQNQEWGTRFINLLSDRQSTIVFGFGLNENMVPTAWSSGALSPAELVQQLEKITELIKRHTDIKPGINYL